MHLIIHKIKKVENYAQSKLSTFIHLLLSLIFYNIVVLLVNIFESEQYV